VAAATPAPVAPAPRVLLLPGAGGDAAFWAPVAALLPAGWETVRLAWPGLGEQPRRAAGAGLEDLVALTLAQLPAPGHLVAQSIGGVVAARVAAGHPELVRSLVLVATSGGIDLEPHGAADWRADYRREYPQAAAWITDPIPADRALLRSIPAPTLLIWGDRDPISPLGVGHELRDLIPGAELRVLPGGGHAVATERPREVAELIEGHISTCGAGR
jgi:pimeloyl-ACP methyl ester carboxylesterase